MGQQDALGRTLIHEAVLRNRIERVKPHLDKLKHSEIVELLAVQDKEGKTPLQYALMSGCGQAFRELFEIVSGSDQSLMQFGATRLIDCLETAKQSSQEHVEEIYSTLIRHVLLQRQSIGDVLRSEISESKTFLQRLIELGNARHVGSLLALFFESDDLSSDLKSASNDLKSAIYMDALGKEHVSLFTPLRRLWPEMTKVVWRAVPTEKRSQLLLLEDGGVAATLMQELVEGGDNIAVLRVLLELLTPEERIHFFLDSSGKEKAVLQKAVLDGRLDIVDLALTLEGESLEARNNYVKIAHAEAAAITDKDIKSVMEIYLSSALLEFDGAVKTLTDTNLMQEVLAGPYVCHNLTCLLKKFSQEQLISWLIKRVTVKNTLPLDLLQQRGDAADVDVSRQIFIQIEENGLKNVPVDEIVSSSWLPNCVASRLDLAQLFLRLFPIDKRLAAIEHCDSGNTVLHCAVEDAVGCQPVEDILDVLSDEQKAVAILGKNKQGNTVLHCAAYSRNAELSKALLQKVLKFHNFKVLLGYKNTKGDTVFHAFAHLGKSSNHFQDLLRIITVEEEGEVFLERNNCDDTALHTAFSKNNIVLLNELFQVVPPSNRQDVLLHKELLLSIAAKGKPDEVATLLKAVPQKLRLNVVIARNVDEDTVLHFVASLCDANALRKILELLAKEDRWQVLMLRNNKEQSAFQIATTRYGYHDVLSILELLPIDVRMEALQSKNESGDAVLQGVKERLTPYILQLLMKLLPNEHKVKVLFQKCKGGNTILHAAPLLLPSEKLVELISLIPPDQRENALFSKNSSGVTVMQQMASHCTRECLDSVLMMSECASLERILETDKHGNTLMHAASLNKDAGVCLSLLKRLPSVQRGEVMLQKNEENRTPLILLVRHCRQEDMYKNILAELPENAVEEVLKGENNAGENVLLVAAEGIAQQGACVLINLLNALPERKKEQGLLTKDFLGRSVLQLALLRSSAKDISRVMKTLPFSEHEKKLRANNRRGGSILHIAAAHSRKLTERILATVPNDSREKVLLTSDNKGNTVLHSAVRSFEGAAFERLLDQLSAERREFAILKKNVDGDTLLHLAASCRAYDLLLAALKLVSKKNRLGVLCGERVCGKTLLQNFAKETSMDRTKELIEMLPAELQVPAMLSGSGLGGSVFHIIADDASKNVDTICEMFKKMPPKQQLEVVLQKGSKGRALIHAFVGRGGEDMLKLFKVISAESRVAVLLSQGLDGGMVLHDVTRFISSASLSTLLRLVSNNANVINAISYNREESSVLFSTAKCNSHDSLRVLLDILHDEDCRVRTLLERYVSGETLVLSAAANFSFDVLYVLLTALPPSKREEVLVSGNKSENTVLHRAVRRFNEVDVKKLLEMIARDKRAAAILEKKTSGSTVLHCAALRKRLSILNVLFGELSAEQVVDAVVDSNLSGDTVLHRAALRFEPDSMKELLSPLPKEQQEAAVLKKNEVGSNVLHFAAFRSNVGGLKFLLGILPADRSAEALSTCNLAGNSVLHFAAKQLSATGVVNLLEGLAEDQREIEVLKENNRGNTMLHIAATRITGHLLFELLERVESGKKLNALLRKNKDGENVFHVAAENFPPNAFNQLLEQFSVIKRSEILLEPNKLGNTVLAVFSRSCSTYAKDNFLMWFAEGQKKAALLEIEMKHTCHSREYIDASGYIRDDETNDVSQLPLLASLTGRLIW